MDKPVKILIVEDEMLIAANISLQLSKLGYEVTGILPRGEEALEHIRQNDPDIALLDIQLKGALDGIETAHAIQKERALPIIFLTANADQAHFERAKATRPFAFISKPFKKLDLERAIELTISQMAGRLAPQTDSSDTTYILSDRIFVRQREKMVKLFLKDILYMEAERAYSRICCRDAEYMLSVPLKELEEKIQADHFLRVHRSFVINLLQLDEVAENHLVIGKRAIPISKSHKEAFLQRIQTI